MSWMDMECMMMGGEVATLLRKGGSSFLNILLPVAIRIGGCL